MTEPAYIDLFNRGVLQERAAASLKRLDDCRICPRNCGVNRSADDHAGFCGAGKSPEIASFGPHFGEESPLVGRNGSGTIFFAHCNLKCSFCQNYDISHPAGRDPSTPEKLAKIMLALQQQGCHNINFVTPSHFVPQILTALMPAVEGGLSVPLVYNSGGYDSVDTLRLLDGVVDIYMPDLKFMDSEAADRYMKAPDYPEIATAAIGEMHRQVGDLRLNKEGIAQRGLLVRHLVFPENLANTREAMRFLARRISRDTYVNVMNQYRPCGEITRKDPAGRSPGREEFKDAIQAAIDEGITRLDERKFFIF
jgi:putative pyruvate formate lyase activating enzyme